ncbi:MAG: hypothetical protein R2827_09585 [Bdellovibrionales bacterium]
MPRELSPSLFGQPQESIGMADSTVSSGETNVHHESTHPQHSLMPQQAQQMDSVEAQVFSAHLEGIKERIHQLGQKMNALEVLQKSEEGSQQIKVDRFQTSVKHLESVLRQHVNDMNTKFAQVVSRFNNQKINESKIEQMIDRHAQMVQNFENKMMKMQKIISEQELQLINYRSELEQARKELARLKKL